MKRITLFIVTRLNKYVFVRSLLPSLVNPLIRPRPVNGIETHRRPAKSARVNGVQAGFTIKAKNFF